MLLHVVIILGSSLQEDQTFGQSITAVLLLPGAFGLRLRSTVDVLPPNYIEMEVCAKSLPECCIIRATDFQAATYKFLQSGAKLQVRVQLYY